MILNDLVSEVNIKVLSKVDLGAEVTSGLCTDLLSLVISGSEKGTVWITHQSHINVIAVALLAELAAVIVIGEEVEEGTVLAAKEKGVNLLLSNESAYNLAGKLYALGIHGKNAAF